MRKKLAFMILSVFLLSTNEAPVFADSPLLSAYSVEDRKQPTDMNYRYDLMGLSVTIMQSNPLDILIKVNFASALAPNAFVYSNGVKPMLRVKILNNLTVFKGEAGYLWLDAPTDVPYQGSTQINAVASVYADPKLGPTGGRKSLSNCNPKTWMDSGASSNWVMFSIDRNCADIADMFWVTAFLDSDSYNSVYMNDFKYAPVDPLYIDTRGFPRPAKKKEQKLSFSAVGNQSMENPQVVTSVTSTEPGVPITVLSFTGTVCRIASQNNNQVTVQLLTSGTCTLDAYSPGSSTVNSSSHYQQSFYIAPIVMKNQEIYWDEPYDVMVGDEDFDLYIYTSAKLPVTVTSQSPSVCQFWDASNPSMVTIIGAGYCQLTVSQAGNERYYSRTATASFYVEKAPVVKSSATPSPRPTRVKSTAAAPKVFTATKKTETQQDITTKTKTGSVSNKGQTKSTITCSKGPLVKKVTDVNPKCPTGWKQKK